MTMGSLLQIEVLNWQMANQSTWGSFYCHTLDDRKVLLRSYIDWIFKHQSFCCERTSHLASDTSGDDCAIQPVARVHSLLWDAVDDCTVSCLEWYVLRCSGAFMAKQWQPDMPLHGSQEVLLLLFWPVKYVYDMLYLSDCNTLHAMKSSCA